MADHKAVTVNATQRKAIYAVMAALLGLGAAFGAWTAEDAAHWATALAQLAGAMSSVLALAHVYDPGSEN
mgnify:CR=1 FL=1